MKPLTIDQKLVLMDLLAETELACEEASRTLASLDQKGLVIRQGPPFRSIPMARLTPEGRSCAVALKTVNPKLAEEARGLRAQQRSVRRQYNTGRRMKDDEERALQTILAALRRLPHQSVDRVLHRLRGTIDGGHL